MGIFVGFVIDTADPLRKGRIRFLIPEFTGPDSVSPWIDVVYPMAVKGTIKPGEMMLLLVVPGVQGEYKLYAIGQIYKAPDSTGTQAPGGLDSEFAGSLGPIDYSRTHIIEVDPDNEEKWIVTVKGQRTSIEIDASTNQIEINPGPNDIILTPGGSRVAVEGDPVQVDTSTGRGSITRGSAPMQARRLS